jgi:peptidyl-prolyl cis-trans isomerase D
MLETLRNNKNSVFGFVIIGFCALLMVPFGLDMIRAGGANSDAIRVDDVEYSMPTFYRQLNRWQNAFRQQLGENYELARVQLNLEQRVVDELVNGALLDRLRETLGLAAATSQIEQRIAAHPFFQGAMTKASYQTFLQVQGLTGFGLEQQTAKEIISEQLTNMLGDLNMVTDEELRAIYRDQERKASFTLLEIKPADFTDKVDTSDQEAIQAYYTDTAEQYRKPRAVRYSFVALKAADYLSRVDITEEDVLDAFESNQHNFFEPKQVRLRKIVFNKKSGNSSALEEMVTGEKAGPSEEEKSANKAVKQEAENALARLESGEDFAKLAIELSDDDTSKAQGGDIGWVSYNVLEGPVREASGSLAVGEHSAIIDAATSFQIVFVEDLKERRQKELSEVRAEIEQTLRNDYAPEYARADAEQLLDVAEKISGEGMALEAAAKEKNLPVTMSEGFLSRLVGSTNFPRELTAKALEISEKDMDIVTLGKDSYVIETIEVKESHIPEFDDVKEEVIQSFIAVKARELAKQRAENLLALVTEAGPENKSPTLSTIAAQEGVSLSTTEPSSRANTTQGPLSLPDLKRAAFSLSPTSPIAPEVFNGNGSYYLIELASSVEPDAAEFEKQIPQLRQQERQSAGSRLTAALIARMRAESEIWVNPELFQAGA